MGFSPVFDYVAGKADWLAYGFPVEPEKFETSIVKARMIREFPRCHPSEPLFEGRERARAAASDVCPVVNEAGILLGLLRPDHWDNDPQARADEVMESGPTTVRPSLAIQEAEEMLAKGKQNYLLVTSSDGKLMGVFKQ